MSSFQQNIDAATQIAAVTGNLTGNVIGNLTGNVIDQTKKAVDNLKDDAEKAKDVLDKSLKNVGDVIVDDAKKTKDALDKSLKNIGDFATKNTNEIIKDIQTEISNPNFSTCLHKTSLFISVVLSLFAAKYYNVVDQKFAMNFVFYLIVIYIVYNSILNMLF